MTSPTMAASRPCGSACMAARISSGKGGVHDGNQFAFIGNIQWIQPQQFTGAAHLRANRQGIFVQADADTGLVCNLVQGGGQATPGGVAQHPDGTPRPLYHFLHQAVKGRGVRLQGGLKLQPLAQRHDRHAVITQGARYQYFVARPGAVAGNIHARAVPGRSRRC